MISGVPTDFESGWWINRSRLFTAVRFILYRNIVKAYPTFTRAIKCRQNFKRKILTIRTYIVLSTMAIALPLMLFPQTASQNLIIKLLKEIREDVLASQPEKLERLYHLKSKAESLHIPTDSIYGRILFELGTLELKVNRNYTTAISFKYQSLRINTSGKQTSSKRDAVYASLHLGIYYEELNSLNMALNYLDTTVQLSKGIPGLSSVFLYSKSLRSYLFFSTGDYQKSVEESHEGVKLALERNDTSNHLAFLNQRAQSYFCLGRLEEAMQDIMTIMKYKQINKYRYEIASALKIKAQVYEEKKQIADAEQCFKQCISLRMGTDDYGQIANDYTDWGNFYFNTIRNNEKANQCYQNVIKYARLVEDSMVISKGYINMGEVALKQQEYAKAASFTKTAMQYLKLNPAENILLNPSSKQLNLIGNADLLIGLMSNKTLILIELYKKNRQLKYLESAIKTAFLTDTIITQTRNEQYGEQSKLYWRNQTRSFFTMAMEACYLANNAGGAFYFMEKSRAVLLNDKLKELGASSHLAEPDEKAEQDFRFAIAIENQKLNNIAPNTAAYNEQLSRLIRRKDDFFHFIKSLETKYPAYYNYKYADAVPTLESLQKHLAVNQESFIHYFTNDTLAYILSITANNTRFIKLLKKDFNYQQITEFLQYSSNRELLNTRYSSFAALSNTLYKTLFQSLLLPKGRVVICSDNFILPFEALCSDAAGKNFLIRDYTFSYAYSATNLLKPYNGYQARGNFIGFAPVSFQPSLHVNALLNSASALTRSADNYSSSLLFTNTTATKDNFIKNIGGYTIANIFSHASADSTENEPRLYMQDGIINLSELQLLNKSATRLVVLSACQTNVGKNATGEGIYSLARGFSAAGIPSIAATLWNADEEIIYAISAKFHEYLSGGMSKDSALQKAKLDLLQSNLHGEKSLPYYWANIILIGNTEPLKLSADSNRWWWITGIAVTILLVIILIVIKKRSGKLR